MTATTLTRVFKFGSIELPDIPGIEKADEVIKQYEPNYPELAFCQLGQPSRDGDRLVYEVVKPAAKTKG